MYKYQPLDRENKEIRLLRICSPTADNVTSKLVLELRHEPLSNKPIQYAALSYVWGRDTSQEMVEVEINGAPFLITRNLHAGLERLLRSVGHDMVPWLWIDAICINQADDFEKSWQVSQMGAIYRQADLVYMMVGSGSAETDRAIEFISRLGPRAMAAGALDLPAGDRFIREYIAARPPSPSQDIDMEYEGDSDLSRFMYDLLHESCLYWSSPPDEDVCAGILEVIRKDYWHRIWITQEVALAGRAIIICGERSVSLDDFEGTLMAMVYGIKSRFRNFAPEYTDFALALPDNFYSTMSLEARRRHLTGEPIRLADLVCKLSAAPKRPFYSASDPRDIFFALLGVISDGKELGLEADYSKSSEDVHTAATKALIRDGDLHHHPFRLDLCVPRKDKERPDDLPSWVPDWMSIGDIGVAVYPINHHGPFSATAGRLPTPVTNDDKSALYLRRSGCYVDVITEVMPPPEWEQPNKWTSFRLQDSQRWIEAVHHFAGLGPASGPAEDYVWRTLMIDTRDGVNSPNRYEPTPPSEDSLRLVRRIMRQESIDVDSLNPAEAEFIRKELYDLGVTPKHINTLEEQLAFAMEDWPETIGSVAYGRTLFKTAKYMFGLGHVAVKPGDIVTLQWGLDSPIILRPRDHTDGGYTFVGDAYVDGIMYGEFLETKPTEVCFDIY